MEKSTKRYTMRWFGLRNRKLSVNNMKKGVKSILTAALIICSVMVNANTRLRKWEVFELSLKAKGRIQNPYADIPVSNNEGLVKVTFTGTSGEATGKKISLFGFWDGGQNWKV